MAAIIDGLDAVYLWAGPKADAEKVADAIRRRGGHYRAIVTESGRLIVTDTAVSSCELVSHADAVAVVSSAITYIPANASRSTTGSRAWGLPERGHAEGFEALTPVPDVEAAAEVLQEITGEINKVDGSGQSFWTCTTAVLPVHRRTPEFVGALKNRLARPLPRNPSMNLPLVTYRRIPLAGAPPTSPAQTPSLGVERRVDTA
jgi:hypothetical protein